MQEKERERVLVSYLQLLIGLLQEIDLLHVFSLFHLPLFVEFLLRCLGIGFGLSQLSFEISLVLFQLDQLERRARRNR